MVSQETRKVLVAVLVLLALAVGVFVLGGGVRKYILVPRFDEVNQSKEVPPHDLPPYEDWEDASFVNRDFLCHRPALEKLVSYQLGGNSKNHPKEMTLGYSGFKYACASFAKSRGITLRATVGLGYFWNGWDPSPALPQAEGANPEGVAEHLTSKYAGIPVVHYMKPNGEPVFYTGSSFPESNIGWICENRGMEVSVDIEDAPDREKQKKAYAKTIFERPGFEDDSWAVLEPIIAKACGPKKPLPNCDTLVKNQKFTVEDLYRCGFKRSDVIKAMSGRPVGK